MDSIEDAFVPSGALNDTTITAISTETPDDASFMPGNSLNSSTIDEFTPGGSLTEPSTSDFVPGNSLSAASEHDFTPGGSLGVLSSATDFTPGNSLDGPSTTEDFTPGNSLFAPCTSKPPARNSIDYDLDSFVPGGSLTQDDDPDLPSLSQICPPMYTSSAPPPPRDDDDYLPWNTVKAKTFNGRTLHIKRKSKVPILARSTERSRIPMATLLDVPIHRLLQDLKTPLSTTTNIIDIIPSQARTIPSEIEEKLWVDAYRPKRFTELLGNDRVCRDAMAWLKQWDYCVFGRGKGKGKGKGKADENGFGAGDDEYRRPREKALMLSGPPGLGKTTLAHVLAHHAGYQVMEINASDARSGSIVDERIRPALESGSAVGSNKPVLLVIDEIDGATGAGDSSSTFVHKLIQLITAHPQRSRKKSSTKQPQESRPILRPIICICNDINASSLSKLRPHTYQLRIQRPADIHTIKRLKEVCESEGLKADSRALSALVGAAQGDMRGCLNTLQFIKARNVDVTEAVIRRATLNMKESEHSLVLTLNDLFNPLSKKRVAGLGLNEDQEARYVGRLARAVDSSGKENSVAIGCFAHYMTRRKHDTGFRTFEKGLEWLLNFDYMSSCMWHDGDFALHGYLSYMLVPFYPLFQERGAPKLERDSADWDCLQRTRTNEEIYKTLARCIRSASLHCQGDFRHFASAPLLQTEFAPYVNRIISPPLRPVNSQVIKPQEKVLLARLVELMVSLELHFVRERGEDGQLVYRLEPPIDVFISYEGKRAVDIPASRYAVRHMVAQEIEMKAISRQADFIEKDTSKGPFGGRLKRRREDDNAAPANKRAKTNEAVDIADRPPTDFFGRLIIAPTTHDSSSSGAGGDGAGSDGSGAGRPAFSVLYKHKEGNSAAVRRPVKVAVFM